jgi:quercetin dioxygenase-like cupin family protein
VTLTGKRRGGAGTACATAMLLLVACQPAAPPPADGKAAAAGSTTVVLDAGRLDALPSGPVYLRMVEFSQPAGGKVPSSQHVPGFVVMLEGVQELQVEGQPPLELHPGQAAFVRSIYHTHLNPGTARNRWYFAAIWPASFRTVPLIDRTARIAYETADLPAQALPASAYTQVLRLVTLEPGGRTRAHTFGGLAVLYVLEGEVSEHAGGASQALTAGIGTYLTPGSPLQVFNSGTSPARLLELLTTADGAPLETPLSHSV